MAIKQGTGPLIVLCIFFFIASFLVYHPYFSEAVLEFLDGFLGPDFSYSPAYERVQMLNKVSGVFLLIALLMGVIAGLWQLFGKE